MLAAPAFWRQDGLLPRLLSPIGGVVAAVTARRLRTPGWRAPVPVICVGNVVVGGSGKTTVALDLGRRLQRRGSAPHFLLRGYGGSSRGARQVAADDDAAVVGDEALLLAGLAPTWTGADRASSARAAIAAGAGSLIMDDGLQNPSLAKTLSLLVIDGAAGIGSGRVLPAGPLREPLEAGAARCQAAVLIGPDRTGIAGSLRLPVLRARLVPGPAMAALAGRRVLAFAGIARPTKFFESLAQAGADVVDAVAFPDHHRFRPAEAPRLIARAAALDAVAVTTAKDAVRLAREVRQAVAVADIGLEWEDEDAIERLLDRSAAPAARW